MINFVRVVRPDSEEWLVARALLPELVIRVHVLARASVAGCLAHFRPELGRNKLSDVWQRLLNNVLRLYRLEVCCQTSWRFS